MDDSSDALLVAEATDAFLTELRNGRQPDVAAFVARYPRVASVLRDMLPALVTLNDSPGSRLGGRLSESDLPEEEPLLRQVGDFRLRAEVGRGGMGVVYDAWQVSLERRVALKVLPFAAALDSRQLQRFKNEAQAAAQLHHTHIVPVYAVGSERGVHYYAMQFIDGRTVGALIDELRAESGLDRTELPPHGEGAQGSATPLHGDGTQSLTEFAQTGVWPEAQHDQGAVAAPLKAGGGLATAHPIQPASDATPPLSGGSTQKSTRARGYFRTVARFIAQASDALEHAHGVGIVHRDVKPGNLMIDTLGHVWVTDFGLAQMQTDSRLTMTGDLIGTLRYMSPEQLLGGRVPIDHRADIYSLGATLYELLTLQPAFGGNDRRGLLQAITFEEPALPRKIDRSIPAELETIVLKAMTKNPVDRYASAREMSDDLERFLRDEPIHARRPTLRQRVQKWARRHRGAVFTAGVSGVLLLSAVAVGAVIFAAQQQTLARTRSDSLVVERKAKAEAQVALHKADAAFREAQQAVDDYLSTVSEDVLLREPGMQPLRRQLLERASTYYQRFVEQRAGDSKARADLALAKLSLASIVRESEGPAAAEPATASALKEFRELVQDEPTSLAARRGLAAALSAEAGLFAVLGRSVEAKKSIAEGLAITEKLVAENPNNHDLILRWVGGLRGAIKVNADLGESQSSLDLARRGLKALKPLFEDGDPKPDLLRLKARLLADEAYTLDDLGQLETALTVRQSQEAILGQLLQDAPSDIDASLEQAGCLTNLAILQRRLGQARAALDTMQRSVAVADESLRKNPSVTRFRESAGSSHNNLGDVQRQLGSLDEAIVQYQLASSLREDLSRDFPQVVSHQLGLARTYANLGLIEIDRGQFPTAVEWQRKAVDVLEKLVAEHSDQLPSEQMLARTHSHLGMALARSGQTEAAHQAYHRSLEIRARLAERHPERPELRSDLAGGYNDYALVLAAEEPSAAAVEYYGKGIALFGDLVREFPKEISNRHSLSLTHYNLGLLQRQQDERTDALASFRAAATVMGDESFDRPDLEYDRAAYWTLVASLLEVDTTLDASSLARERTRLLDQSIAGLRRAVSLGFADVARLAQDPDFEALREHPEFQNFVQPKSSPTAMP